MKRIDYNPNSLSHHNENIQYWVTQGIVIDGERYSVEELFVRGNTLYGVISTDKIDFYEYPLATNVTQDKFDPSGILNRLDRLESIPQYKYDDTGINQRLDSIREDLDDNKTKIDQRVKLLENKPDNDNQNLSISGNNLSISGGNTVEIPQPDLRVLNDFATKEYVDTLVKSSSYNPKPILDRIEILEAKPDKDTVYDDTALKERVKNLEDKPEKTNQTLAINDRTISISNGNSIELPADKDTVYDDSAVIERISNLESKKYKVKGNGLFLDDDGTFHLEIAKKPEINYPYRSNGNAFIKLSPDIRTIDNLGNPIYSIDNDGTLQKSAVIESGLMFNYELSYDYKDTVFTSRGTNVILSKCATNANGVGDCSSLLLDKNIMLEISFYSNWKDKDNKVSIKVIPRIIWTFITDDSTEHYTHHITKEELESEEPIEIELKKNSKVTNSLRLTLKDTRFFMQSVQGTIALKNPEDNKFYNIPRLN